MRTLEIGLGSPHRVLAAVGGAALLVAVVVLGLSVTEYRATYSAQAVGADHPHETVPVGDLPADCRPLARALADGRTVSETGYQFPSERRLDPGRTAGGDPLVLVRRTNHSDGWTFDETFCGDHLSTGRDVRVDGQVYHVWGTTEEGLVGYRHRLALSLLALGGLGLLGLGLIRNRVR